MLIEFKLFSACNPDPTRVLINPRSVASIKQEGHRWPPPTCTIETHSGERYLVNGAYDDVKGIMMEDLNLHQAIENLRKHCNLVIKHINLDGAEGTPGFETINGLLKECDKVFRRV